LILKLIFWPLSVVHRFHNPGSNHKIPRLLFPGHINPGSNHKVPHLLFPGHINNPGSNHKILRLLFPWHNNYFTPLVMELQYHNASFIATAIWIYLCMIVNSNNQKSFYIWNNAVNVNLWNDKIHAHPLNN
jgi:hypothetical protein